MKHKKFLLIIFLFSLSVTITMSQVKSDYDKSTDFSEYKTYSFAGWQKDSDQQLNDFDKKRILESLRSEFEARGMTYVESGGDAHIALFLQLDDKKSTTSYTNYMGGMGYGARWGWGMGVGMGSATTICSENDYMEGTLGSRYV